MLQLLEIARILLLRLPGVGDIPRHGHRPDEITEFEQFKQFGNNKERIGEADYRVASPDDFRAMGIPIVRGRSFGPADRLGASPLALLNEEAPAAPWMIAGLGVIPETVQRGGHVLHVA